MNLLEMIKGELTEAALGKLGDAVGLKSADAGKAMNAIIPTQLASLVNMGSNTGGAQNLLDLAGKFTSLGGLGGLLGQAGGAQNLMKMGESLLPSLFGGKSDAVVGALAAHLGLNRGAVGGLMSLAGPVVMGMLGKQAKSQGLNAAGLVGLLGGLKGVVGAAMPAGLGKALEATGAVPGLSGLLSGGLGQAAGGVARAAGVATATATTAKRAGFPMWLPIAALLALLALVLAFCNRMPQTTGTPATGTPAVTAPAGTFAITEPLEGATLPAGAFALKGTGKPGETVSVSENGTALGSVTVGEDGTWSLNVPSGAEGARAYAVTSPSGNLTLNVTAAAATGSAADCTSEFSLSITDGQTVSEPFRFGGAGKGQGYAVTVKRGDRTVGVKQIPLDATCGWSYTSKPGAGPITYEVREIGAAGSSEPLARVNLTVQ